MKKTLLLLMLLVTGIIASAQDAAEFSRLIQLSREDQFFRLERELKLSASLSEAQKLYFEAITASVFNRPGESNSAIKKLLELHRASLTDSMALTVYECLITNCVRIFDYRSAQTATDSAVAIGRKVSDSKSVEDILNSGLIWKAARDLPAQTFSSSGETKIPLTKDMAGLSNVAVKINGHKDDVIFDTGANFSTVRESVAREHGLKFLDGTVKVGNATGGKVDSRLAYAGSLEIGNMKFGNVLFLVLPDEALSFGGGVYVIDAIIGLPVIMQMGEVHLSRDELLVPSIPGSNFKSNLALDGYTPVVEVAVNADTLVFSFDTGADRTMLYHRYFDLHRKSIESEYETEEIHFGGAGSEKRVQGYKLDDLKFSVAGSSTVLNDVSLLTKNVKDDEEMAYGNLGNDYFKEFRTMIIDFRSMSLRFEK